MDDNEQPEVIEPARISGSRVLIGVLVLLVVLIIVLVRGYPKDASVVVEPSASPTQEELVKQQFELMERNSIDAVKVSEEEYATIDASFRAQQSLDEVDQVEIEAKLKLMEESNAQ